MASDISLRDKIGQMLLIGFEGKMIDAKSSITKAIEEDNIGGVILFDYNSRNKTFDMNIETPEQVNKLNHQLKQVTHEANIAHHRADLPLLISVDYEGGKVNRLKEKYGFPITVSAKEIGKMSMEEAEMHASAMGNTLRFTGFNLDFAPVTDVDVNPENPIIGKHERSFSVNPEEVTTFASIFSQQFLQWGVQCAYKHFPGHGSSTADSHLGFVDVTDSWHEQELIPYLQLLSQPKHCGVVMTAHIINRKLDASGVPATLSQTILTGILRHELKFDGVIITDDMQMKAIADNYSPEDAITMAINAGADMLIFGNQLPDSPQDPKDIINIIQKKVEIGEIAVNRINEAYRHITALKKSLKSH